MSEQVPVTAATTIQPKPVPEGYSSWNDYWTKEHNQLWRTEPEVDEDRQRHLAKCRVRKVIPGRAVFPFSGEELDRADVEWLLATLEHGRGPIDWSDPNQRFREGLDLRGANLSYNDLSGLPLANLRGGMSSMDAYGSEDGRLYKTTPEDREIAAINLYGADLTSSHLENAWLFGAHMETVNLYDAHLEEAFLGEAHLERARLQGVHLERARLFDAHLELARFWGVVQEVGDVHGLATQSHLEEANLRGAYLNGADLRNAHLEAADLRGAHFEGKHLSSDELEKIRVWDERFPEVVPPTKLTRAFMDAGTNVDEVTIGNREQGYPFLADVRWGEVNLAVVPWLEMSMTGDERVARERQSPDGKKKDRSRQLSEFQTAVRANLQLSTVLRVQGLNQHADRYAYRAQVCQRNVLRHQQQFLRYLGSFLLDLICGYGYRPMRSFITYLAVIVGFAALYFVLRDSVHPSLNPLDALVFSITSFHGRGFNPGETVTLHNPLTIFAAIEAIIGLLIEITFIATFTQRVFAR